MKTLAILLSLAALSASAADIYRSSDPVKASTEYAIAKGYSMNQRSGTISNANVYGIGGCVVWTHSAPFDELEAGDLVIYRSQRHGLVSHPVIKERHPGQWMAKGTNNAYPDREYVTAENYIGTIVAVFPAKGGFPFEVYELAAN